MDSLVARSHNIRFWRKNIPSEARTLLVPLRCIMYLISSSRCLLAETQTHTYSRCIPLRMLRSSVLLLPCLQFQPNHFFHLYRLREKRNSFFSFFVYKVDSACAILIDNRHQVNNKAYIFWHAMSPISALGKPLLPPYWAQVSQPNHPNLDFIARY